MDYERSPAKSRYLTILCCILTAMWLIAFVGCQGVTEPPPSSKIIGENGSLSQAQTIFGLPVETGPIITLANEYMDPVVSPKPGGFMKIPAGIPLEFCWTAKRASGGGSIEAYRYGWDVFDLNDPEAWEAELEERREWDVALADGLKED